MARDRVQRFQDTLTQDWSNEEREKLLNFLLDEHFDSLDEAKRKAKIVRASEFREAAEENIKNWGKIVGVRTEDYWEIDNMTGGFAPGEMTVISAPTSVGKTMICVNLAAAMMQHGYKVLFVSLEDGPAQILPRLNNVLGSEDYNAILDIDMLRFQEQFRIDFRSIKFMVENAKEWGANIVFIDHLHYLARDMADQATGLGLITQELKMVAMENNMPLILVCHMRKLPEGRTEPIIDDLRGSSYIAQDADEVLLLHRENIIDAQTNREYDYLVCKCWKNRNRAGIWKVYSSAMYRKDGMKLIPNPYNKNFDDANRA